MANWNPHRLGGPRPRPPKLCHRPVPHQSARLPEIGALMGCQAARDSRGGSARCHVAAPTTGGDYRASAGGERRRESGRHSYLIAVNSPWVAARRDVLATARRQLERISRWSSSPQSVASTRAELRARFAGGRIWKPTRRAASHRTAEGEASAPHASSEVDDRDGARRVDHNDRERPPLLRAPNLGWRTAGEVDQGRDLECTLYASAGNDHSTGARAELAPPLSGHDATVLHRGASGNR